MVEISEKVNIEIMLAYYPPYHSKYNPVESMGSIRATLGDLLDSKNTVIEFTKTMTWNCKNPNVIFIDKTYNIKQKDHAWL